MLFLFHIHRADCFFSGEYPVIMAGILCDSGNHGYSERREKTMTRQKTLKFALLFLLSLSGLAGAVQTALAGQSVWNHNGSQMLLEANGNQRIITYLVPRRGISAQPGQLLFQGVRNGRFYSGTAYTFRRGCSPAPYQVSGRISSEHRIVLRGASPKRQGCRVVGYSNSSSNSRLVFTYIRKIAGAAQGIPDAVPLDPGFAGPQDGAQEGPLVGPLQETIKLIPGGRIVFQIQDQDDPAAAPIRIDAEVQCASGKRLQVLDNYRTCAFDGFDIAPDGMSIVMNMRNYNGNRCAVPKSSTISVAQLCP